jgi:hypothetical protein
LTAKSPIPLDISVLIQVSFVKKDQMYSVLRSLTADNVRFPPGLSMEMLVDSDRNILIRFYSSIGFETLINTVDEVLEHISVASKVLSHD